MKLPAYPRTKPSGVEWLGDVPEHWDVKRSDAIVSADRSQLSPEKFADLDVFHYSIPVVQETGTGQVENGESIASAKQVVKKPVVLVSKLNPRKATICLAKPQAILTLCSTEFVALNADKCELAFLEYLTRSELFRQGLDSKVQSVTRSHQRANPADIYKFWNAWPTLEDQRAIAVFLDRETGRLDRLVAKKQEVIERLKEKRAALISLTVTRGLPPAAARAAGLPEKRTLKPSGLDWLGDIPKHWEIRKFSREIAIAEGQADPEKEPYASMLLIGPEHVESATGRLLQRESASDQAAESGKYFSRKGDLIYSKIRPALRKLVIAPEDCLCSADMYPLRARKRLDNRFIFWLFLSEQFSGWSVLESDRVAMPKINRDTLNELRMPVPPLTEQAAIAAYLEAETANLDALVGKVETAVERLQEYRAALITAAVSGKIDVRGRVAVSRPKTVASAKS